MSALGHVLSELRLYICNNVVGRLPSRRMRMLFYQRVMLFEIASSSHIFLGCTFSCAGGLRIGTASVINRECHLDCRGTLEIGSNVSISQEAMILTADHDPSSPSFKARHKAVKIEDYVFVGSRALIMPGVTMGKGSIAAAGAVVTKDVPPFSIVGGSPARIIRERSHDLEYCASYSRLFQ